MAAPARLTYLPDLVESHFDEVQFLWAQRRGALRSPAYTAREIALLEERIEAHLQGMLVIGDRIVDVVAPGLAGEEELPAFAAAFALLRLGTPDAQRLVGRAFEQARGKTLCGIRDALASAPAHALHDRLTSLFLAAASPVGAAAGEVLAFHGSVTLNAGHLERLVTADEPGTRAGGWRLAAHGGIALAPRLLDAALHDESPAVKRAAETAAAWTRSPSFAPYCRALAADPAPESIGTLASFAAIAPPEEYQLVAALAGNAAAGPDRFRVVGSFAHPYFVELLVTEMRNPDAAAAAAAGAAFTKMTGRDVESNERAPAPPGGEPPADEFEAEFQDEVFLPDPALARRHWQELAPALAQSPRICRGMDVSQPLSPAQLAALDMESRWEHGLRARLAGASPLTPFDLERYPRRA